MIGGANPAVMQSQARALRDVERENQRVAVAVARTSQKISDQSLVTARARREMSGFERSLRTTATTLNVVQGPLGPIAGRVGALAAAVGELTGFRLGLAGTGAAQIGRAHVCTPVTNAHLVCRLLLEKNNKK